MKRVIVTGLFAIICFLLLTACSEKQKALDELEDFTENIEKHGDSWDDVEWKQKADEFLKLQSEMRKYDYNSEENQEIGNLEGRCLSDFANHASGGLLEKMKGMSHELNGIINGFLKDDGN